MSLRPMVAGEPILRSRLSGEGGRATLSAVLASGNARRGDPISDVAGVAGFAPPGTVDVLLTREINGEQVTEILLNNIKLIAIDQNANDNVEQPALGRTATLEVSQEDAQRLALGGAVGTLSLVLRSVRAPQEQSSRTTTSCGGAGDLAGGGNYSPGAATGAGRAADAGAGAGAAAGAAGWTQGNQRRGGEGHRPTDYEVRRYGG